MHHLTKKLSSNLNLKSMGRVPIICASIQEFSGDKLIISSNKIEFLLVKLILVCNYFTINAGSGMSSGVNFAIPVDTVLRTVPSLIVYGTPYSNRY